MLRAAAVVDTALTALVSPPPPPRCAGWAFGSTEAFNDRLAIAHNFTNLLSPADTLSCCTGFSQGCDGGFPDEAWQWFTSTGVVTGGLYGSPATATCENYPFPACAHHVAPTPGYPACPTNDYNTVSDDGDVATWR